jgi:phosphoribosylanthranilate isomerase
LGISGNGYHIIPEFIYGKVLLIGMSTAENKTSKSSTSTAKDAAAPAVVNVAPIFDVANENFTKLVNEAAKVQLQYVQAISNLDQEYIEAARNAIQTITSVEKQFTNSNSSNFNNVVVSDTAAPYIQGIVKQSNDFTNNIIRMADISNQLTINSLNALREGVKDSSRTVEATAEFNTNVAKAWAISYSTVQQQFAGV